MCAVGRLSGVARAHSVLRVASGPSDRIRLRRTRVAKLYFRYGAMNSGKSTGLLQTAYNY